MMAFLKYLFLFYYFQIGVGNEGVSTVPEKTPHNNNVSNSHLEDSKLSSSPHPTKPKVNNNNGEQQPKKHKPKVNQSFNCTAEEVLFV